MLATVFAEHMLVGSYFTKLSNVPNYYFHVIFSTYLIKLGINMQTTVVQRNYQQTSPGCSAPMKLFCRYLKNWTIFYLNTYQAEYGKLYLTSELVEGINTDICLWS